MIWRWWRLATAVLAGMALAVAPGIGVVIVAGLAYVELMRTMPEEGGR